MMTKKETAKFVIQVIVSIASAILTALGATSCMSHYYFEKRFSLKKQFIGFCPSSEQVSRRH